MEQYSASLKCGKRRGAVFRIAPPPTAAPRLPQKETVINLNGSLPPKKRAIIWGIGMQVE